MEPDPRSRWARGADWILHSRYAIDTDSAAGPNGRGPTSDHGFFWLPERPAAWIPAWSAADSGSAAVGVPRRKDYDSREREGTMDDRLIRHELLLAAPRSDR